MYGSSEIASSYLCGVAEINWCSVALYVFILPSLLWNKYSSWFSHVIISRYMDSALSTVTNSTAMSTL